MQIIIGTKIFELSRNRLLSFCQRYIRAALLGAQIYGLDVLKLLKVRYEAIAAACSLLSHGSRLDELVVNIWVPLHGRILCQLSMLKTWKLRTNFKDHIVLEVGCRELAPGGSTRCFVLVSIICLLEFVIG